MRVTTGESRGDPAVLNPDLDPVRITEITLRPHISVTGDASEARIRKLVHSAHGYCFIANSLTSAMSIEPTVEWR